MTYLSEIQNVLKIKSLPHCALAEKCYHFKNVQWNWRKKPLIKSTIYHPIGSGVFNKSWILSVSSQSWVRMSWWKCSAAVIEMVIINFGRVETFCQIFFPGFQRTHWALTTIFPNINKVPKWPFRQFCVQLWLTFSREPPIELLLQIDWIFSLLLAPICW